MNTGTKRTACLPDAPTVIESGIKDYDVASWNRLSVPAKLRKQSSPRQQGHERLSFLPPEIQSEGLAPRAPPARTMMPVELNRGTGS